MSLDELTALVHYRNDAKAPSTPTKLFLEIQTLIAAMFQPGEVVADASVKKALDDVVASLTAYGTELSCTGAVDARITGLAARLKALSDNIGAILRDDTAARLSSTQSWSTDELEEQLAKEEERLRALQFVVHMV